ncbi:Hsp70 family protein [Actinoplanes sp. HUAS TT8]|uniref:Hsp70 family protein n=1 Tax=Actinoplanes sp. HUAS TT8 TaxID=3447453 RepID=UPI003F51B677
MEWTLAVDVGDTSCGAAGDPGGAPWEMRWPVPPGTMPLRELGLRLPGGRDAVAAELRTARGDRTRPHRLVLVHPAAWAGGDLDELREAARRAGLPAPEFTPTPVAAAGTLAAGERVMVYDFGGHGADLAVVASAGGRPQVVAAAEEPEPFGGIDLDDIILRLVTGHAADRDPGMWAVARDALDEDAGDRLKLLGSVTAARETLSAERAATVTVPGLAEPVMVTRGEFEELAEPELAGVLDRLDRILGDAGPARAGSSAAVLTGGVARTPLLADLVAARFGGPVRVGAAPELTAVRGAAAGRPGRRAGARTVTDDLDDYFGGGGRR